MSLQKILLRLLLGKRRAEEIRVAKIMRSPDRLRLVEAYFPAFAQSGGRILWIGCQAYTTHYPDLLEARGAEVWTTDVDADAAGFGRAGRHRTGDLKTADLLFADLTFDAILCNGVLGFGVNTMVDQQRALSAMATLLRPGGRLLLGWNTDRISDPVAAGLTDPYFKRAPFADLPQRATFPTVTHVFDLFERR